jgi:predicted nucleic-acid-binding protein
VRLVTRDDARQVGRAEAFVEKGAWVSHLVLAETTWVLTSVYRLPPKRIALMIEMLLDHDKLTLEHADAVAAALVEYRRRPAVGFSDCLILAVARKAGHLPLGTLDRKLGGLSGAERL